MAFRPPPERCRPGCGPSRLTGGPAPSALAAVTRWRRATMREGLMREYVWLECTSCGDRNYRTQKETRGADRLELKKYCRRERKHTPHKESRKK